MSNYKHQDEAKDFLVGKQYAALFLEQGLGKTKITCDRIAEILKHQPNFKILIVCPKTLITNWVAEFRRWQPHIKTLKWSKRDSTPEFQVFIHNYEGLQNLPNDIWDVIVLDESIRIKNHKSIAANMLCELFVQNAKLKYILTGLPTTNSYLDIYQQIKFLDGGESLGYSFYGFRNRFFYDENKNISWKKFPKWVPKRKDLHGIDGIEEIQKLIENFCFVRKKKDCLDLPEKTYETLSVEMSPEQTRLYKDMLRNFIATIQTEFGETQIPANYVITKLMKLRQITSGFMIDENDTAHDIKDNSKLAAVSELLEAIAPNTKVIIWACFVRDIEKLVYTLKKWNPVSIYGKNSDADSVDAAKKSFMEDENCRVLIANPASAKYGHTFTASNYSIYYSQDWNLDNRMQSEDRIHRIGAEKHDKITYVDIIATGTIDETISAALRDKKTMGDRLLDLKALRRMLMPEGA